MSVSAVHRRSPGATGVLWALSPRSGHVGPSSSRAARPIVRALSMLSETLWVIDRAVRP